MPIPGYTPINIDVFLAVTASTIPFTGGIGLVINFRKQGGTWYQVTWTEIGYGVYRIAPSVSDQDTPGVLLYYATATGAQDAAGLYWIGTDLPFPLGKTYYSLPSWGINSSGNPQTGLLNPQTVICPQGANSFALAQGPTSEVGFGWYELLPAVADVSQPGFMEFALVVSGVPYASQTIYVSPPDASSGATSGGSTIPAALTIDPSQAVILR
jgi:hypothetical protein